MIPVSVNSLIRRSLNHAQLASPMIENDDEAERAFRRASLAPRSRASLAPDNAIIQHKEGFDNCLKIFNENKISKENVWQINMIDHFRALIDKHHKTLNSFQMVSSSLEASSKIYGMRVDSVHSDVLRMSSGLIRQKIVENPDDITDDTLTDQTNQEQRPMRRNRRPNRFVNTVTKNKDTINAKLEQSAEMDAIFAKLNSTVENNNSTKKLLQYVLSSCDSALRLSMNYKMWNNEEAPINDPDTLDFYEEPFDDMPEIKFLPSDNNVLRPQITGYIISNRPAEDDGDDQMDTFIDGQNDKSYIDAHFDIDANVEPIQVETGFIDIDIVTDDFGSLDEDDQCAINACHGLQRGSIVINDMRPDNISLDLEYSYRLLSDKIHRFWAGPSYWKFKKLRANAVPPSLADKKKKTIKNKVKPIEFEDADESLYISINGRPADKLKKFNIYNNKRFKPRLNKLPFDYKLNRNRFLLCPLAPGICWFAIQSSGEADEYTVSNFDNNDGNDGFNASFNVNNSVVKTHNNECSNATVTEIGTEFVGAPEQVNQINIKFAKTAKVIDMKQLKHCCLNIIRKQCKETAAASDLPSKSQTLNEDYCAGSSSFYQIYKGLPEKLTKNMKEALSPAVAFYSILHLANDNNFRLIKDDENGFLIRQIL